MVTRTDGLTDCQTETVHTCLSLPVRQIQVIAISEVRVGHGVPCRPIFTRLGGKLLLLLITNHKQCQQSQTGNIERRQSTPSHY